jgi:hypothetical protein
METKVDLIKERFSEVRQHLKCVYCKELNAYNYSSAHGKLRIQCKHCNKSHGLQELARMVGIPLDFYTPSISDWARNHCANRNAAQNPATDKVNATDKANATDTINAICNLNDKLNVTDKIDATDKVDATDKLTTPDKNKDDDKDEGYVEKYIFDESCTPPEQDPSLVNANCYALYKGKNPMSQNSDPVNYKLVESLIEQNQNLMNSIRILEALVSQERAEKAQLLDRIISLESVLNPVLGKDKTPIKICPKKRMKDEVSDIDQSVSLETQIHDELNLEVDNAFWFNDSLLDNPPHLLDNHQNPLGKIENLSNASEKADGPETIDEVNIPRLPAQRPTFATVVKHHRYSNSTDKPSTEIIEQAIKQLKCPTKPRSPTLANEDLMRIYVSGVRKSRLGEIRTNFHLIGIQLRDILNISFTGRNEIELLVPRKSALIITDTLRKYGFNTKQNIDPSKPADPKATDEISKRIKERCIKRITKLSNEGKDICKEYFRALLLELGGPIEPGTPGDE